MTNKNGLNLDGVDFIKYHVKTKNRIKRGIFAVSVDRLEKEIHVGWSLCNKRDGDLFDREQGLKIACGRMRVNKVKINDMKSYKAAIDKIPSSMHDDFDRIISRAKRILEPRKSRELALKA